MGKLINKKIMLEETDTILTQVNPSGTMEFRVEKDGDVEIKQDGKKQMCFRVERPKQFIKDLDRKGEN